MDEEGRHHIIRNKRFKESLKLIVRDGFSCIISSDILISAFFNHCNSSTANKLMFQNGALNLTKLNAISSYLHLRVNSADILNVSVTFHADHITGSVKTFVLFAYRERIFNKYRGSFFRKIMVSSCNLPAGMAKLTRCPNRKSVQIFIHNIAADISL